MRFLLGEVEESRLPVCSISAWRCCVCTKTPAWRQALGIMSCNCASFDSMIISLLKDGKRGICLQDVCQLLEGRNKCFSLGARIVRPTYMDAEGVRWP